MTGRLQQYHFSQASTTDRRKTGSGQRKLIKILPSYGSFLKEGRRTRWQRLLTRTLMTLTHDRFQRHPSREHLPVGGRARPPQGDLPGQETSLRLPLILPLISFLKGEIPLPTISKAVPPLRVYFQYEKSKKKQKTKKNRHHYLYSSVSAVRNLDHLHSFQALISENSHFRNKTPWKCSTSKFSYSLRCYSFLHQFLCLPNRSLKIV